MNHFILIIVLQYAIPYVPFYSDILSTIFNWYLSIRAILFFLGLFKTLVIKLFKFFLVNINYVQNFYY